MRKPVLAVTDQARHRPVRPFRKTSLSILEKIVLQCVLDKKGAVLNFVVSVHVAIYVRLTGSLHTLAGVLIFVVVDLSFLVPPNCQQICAAGRASSPSDT